MCGCVTFGLTRDFNDDKADTALLSCMFARKKSKSALMELNQYKLRGVKGVNLFHIYIYMRVPVI